MAIMKENICEEIFEEPLEILEMLTSVKVKSCIELSIANLMTII